MRFFSYIYILMPRKPPIKPELVNAEKYANVGTWNSAKDFVRYFFKSLITIVVSVAAISALVYFGYVIGCSIGTSKFDRDKADLNITNNNLKDTIRRLKSHLDFQLINRENWIVANSTNITFNKSQPLPTLTVSTTSNPCIGGNVNNCWQNETEIFRGDTLSIQIVYKNEGRFPVPNVTIGFNSHLVKNESLVIFRGGISAGDRIVEWGVSSAYYSFNSKLQIKFMPERTFWYKSRVVIKQLTAVNKLGNNYIEVGTVKPNETGVVIFNYSVLNSL